MADIRINQDNGDLAVPDPSGGYRIYKRGDYKMDSDNNRVAVPDIQRGGFVMYDLPAKSGPVFNPKELGRSFIIGTRQTIERMTSPITMTTDAINAVTKLQIKGANTLFDTEIPEFQTASGAINRGL